MMYVNDWPEPPASDHICKFWEMYCLTWEQLNYSAPAYWIRKWMIKYGLPNDCEGMNEEFKAGYAQALIIYETTKHK